MTRRILFVSEVATGHAPPHNPGMDLHHITVKRGPDEGCEVDIIRLDPPAELEDMHGNIERRRWKVECTFHGNRLILRTRREADKDARRPGTWCRECRMERHEEHDE